MNYKKRRDEKNINFLFQTYQPSFDVSVGGCCEFIQMLLEYDECFRYRPRF